MSSVAARVLIGCRHPRVPTQDAAVGARAHATAGVRASGSVARNRRRRCGFEKGCDVLRAARSGRNRPARATLPSAAAGGDDDEDDLHLMAMRGACLKVATDAAKLGAGVMLDKLGADVIKTKANTRDLLTEVGGGRGSAGGSESWNPADTAVDSELKAPTRGLITPSTV